MTNTQEEFNNIKDELSKILSLLESVAISTQKNTVSIGKLGNKVDDIRLDLNRHSILALDKYATKESLDKYSQLLTVIPKISQLEIRISSLEKLSGRN